MYGRVDPSVCVQVTLNSVRTNERKKFCPSKSGKPSEVFRACTHQALLFGGVHVLKRAKAQGAKLCNEAEAFVQSSAGQQGTLEVVYTEPGRQKVCFSLWHQCFHALAGATLLHRPAFSPTAHVASIKQVRLHALVLQLTCVLCRAGRTEGAGASSRCCIQGQLLGGGFSQRGWRRRRFERRRRCRHTAAPTSCIVGVRVFSRSQLK
jgi:hypothetical protein